MEGTLREIYVSGAVVGGGDSTALMGDILYTIPSSTGKRISGTGSGWCRTQFGTSALSSECVSRCRKDRVWLWGLGNGEPGSL